MTALLFVCMGNICRSPTAEGVMRSLLEEAGLAGRVRLDSAGTGGWHAGHPPDPRATQAAARRGIVLTGEARRLQGPDLSTFDLLLCADADNVREVLRLIPEQDAATRARVRRLREFDPLAVAAGDLDVPDPYYGGPDGFDTVLDLVTAACEGVLEHVRAGVVGPGGGSVA